MSIRTTSATIQLHSNSRRNHLLPLNLSPSLNGAPRPSRFPFQIQIQIRCSASDSKARRGFGRQSSSNNKDNKAPGLNSRSDGNTRNFNLDTQFEERLQAVQRAALEQKKADEIKEYGPIDYDAPVESEKSTISLGTKIGIGVAVIVFGLLFAVGDFLPSESESSSEKATVVAHNLSDEEKSILQTRLQQYEATLGTSPKDLDALKGATVTLVELGDYSRASSLLEDLSKEKPNDPEVFRLLGEVRYELKNFEGSAAAYRRAGLISKGADFELLRGLTNALLAAKKPDEAVQVLLASRDRLKSENGQNTKIDSGGVNTEPEKLDPIQVELLLGKAYSDWGHVSDAITVYDQLISSYPDDFRGYLAKGILLKENGRPGDAERMFIQARFFAPEKAKALVDQTNHLFHQEPIFN
ncbi:hypothetical protein RJ641_020334, partial [Dillenia turbinata]